MAISQYTTGRGTSKRKYWRIDAWIKDVNGVSRRLLQSKIPTREQAEALLAKTKAEAFEAEHFPKRKLKVLTVAEAWELYEPIAQRDKRSAKTDAGRAKHLVEHLGAMRLATLNQGTVDRYRSARMEQRSLRGKAPSTATLNREVALLKRMAVYAVSVGDLSVNPLAKVGLMREDNIRESWLDAEAFSRLLAGADAWFQPILILAFDTGMRRSEILKLRQGQVDLARRTISLSARDTKTRNARTVHLSPRATEALRALPRPISGDGFLFPALRGNGPMNDIRKAWKRACDKAGLKGLWFHDLRRSFSTNARRVGVPESVIMKMTGHKTRSAFARYNIVEDDDIVRAVERIEAARTVAVEQVGG